MLKSYFKIAFRNLVKNKYNTLISIFSLSVAISCFIFAYAYFVHDTNYDTYHKDYDRIYRIITETKFFEPVKLANTSELLARELKEVSSDFEYVARITTGTEAVLKKDNMLFTEKNFFYAEQDFLNIFSTPFILGSRDNALLRPGTVILIQSIAQKYFGNSNPIGQELFIDNKSFEVTGVVPAPPSDTHLKYSVLASFATIEPNLEYRDWTRYNNFTYIKLKPSTNVELFNKLLYDIASKYINDEPGYYLHHKLQPVSDIHTNTELKWDIDTHTNKDYLYILLAIGIITMAMASINLINISVSQSLSRLKEIGIRKVSGATKGSIIYQFFVDSLIILFLSTILVIILSDLFAPVFNQLTGIDFSLKQEMNTNWILLLSSIIFIISAVSCIYPALVISSIRPALIFRKMFTSMSRGDTLKTVLMTTQYSVTIVLIICLSVMLTQTNYMKSQYLGFNKGHKLILEAPNDKIDFEFLAKELSGYPTIKSASVSSAVMGGRISFGGIPLPGDDTGLDSKKVMHLFANYNFLKNYKFEMIAGDINRFNSDGLKKGIIVNEEFVRTFGWHNNREAVGQYLYIPWVDKKLEILGVVKNFHYAGLQKNIEPLLIYDYPEFYRYITLETRDNAQETISFLKDKWASILSDSPFNFFFLDEFFNRNYNKDDKIVTAVSVFSWIGISIACFGLIGITNYNIQRKIKEVGIRKVFGASLYNLFKVFINKIFLIILLAGIIGSPIAYFLMNKWLNQYAYRIELNIFFFIISILLVIFISLSLIIYPLFKAVIANPIDSLRYE